MPVILGISGPPHSGKTTLVRKLIKTLTSNGVTCGGVISLGTDERRYFNIATREERPYYLPKDELLDFSCRKISKPAIEFGCNAISVGISTTVLFIDEVGKLERERQGYYECLLNLLPKRDLPVVIIIRSELLQLFPDLFGLSLTKTWILKKKADGEAIFNDILREIENNII